MRIHPSASRIASTTLLVLATFIAIPAASATTTSFPCGLGGTYQVNDSTHQLTGETNCEGDLNIDPSVTSIADSVFAYNHDLAVITIPASVTTIGEFAFREAHFDSIVFNEGLTTLSSYVFYGSYNRGARLDLVLPNSITTIGNAVFAQSYFNSISIGPNVTTLGSEVFYNNFGFGPTSVIFRGSPTFTQLSDTIFIGYRGDEIDLPVSITTIGTRIFEGAGYMSYLIVPPAVTQIGDYAFQVMSDLKTVVFPDSLTTLGTGVFTSTPNIETVIYCGSSSAVLNYTYPNGVHPVCAKGAIFMPNGGSGSMRTETATSTTNLSSNTLTRNNYTFSGWNTRKDGSGSSYADGAPFPFTSTSVLYAQWTAMTVPGAPNVGAPIKVSTTSATIDFTAPGSNGGSVIDFFECESSPASTTVTVNQASSGTCTFTGLTTSTTYRFKVRAHNSIGYSNFSGLSAALSLTDLLPDLEAEKREAQRRRDADIAECMTALKKALINKEKISPGKFSSCGYRSLTEESTDAVVDTLQLLPVESKTSDSMISTVVTKVGLYEDLQSNRTSVITPRALVQAEIIPASVPFKTVVVLQLFKLDISARDSVGEIDAFIAAQAQAMEARKERLSLTISRIQSR